ncbi:MarR family winged helix-turn-helix transcriptional regulator [Streptomyces sp. NPDC087843]|uniref:MarR family winged helix-turn-helix transcriptional regulator n=1 Tax=Streptomyces sp. NPDC087843 TaxID=3365804 RepID=UPI00380531EE
MARADDSDERAGEQDPGVGPERERAAPTDLQAFAVQLRRMNGEVNRVVHGFAGEHGLHATDVQALAAILDAAEPLTPGRLGEHLGLTSGAVTACLDRLERAGHIRRVRDSPDRRVVHLHWVPDAKSAARAHFRPLAEVTASVRSGFSEDELSVVLRFLTAMNEQLSGVRSPGR